MPVSASNWFSPKAWPTPEEIAAVTAACWGESGIRALGESLGAERLEPAYAPWPKSDLTPEQRAYREQEQLARLERRRREAEEEAPMRREIRELLDDVLRLRKEREEWRQAVRVAKDAHQRMVLAMPVPPGYDDLAKRYDELVVLKGGLFARIAQLENETLAVRLQLEEAQRRLAAVMEVARAGRPTG